ncbi:MAG: V-type ATP synthase subunit E [Candidatus Thorarchaeota archaeon]
MTGVNGIVEMIERKTSEKVEEIIKKAEDYKAKRIAKAEEEAKRRKQSIIDEARREAQALLKRYEASAKLRAKHRVLELKNRIMTEVLDEAIEKAKQVTTQPDYKVILTRLVVEGADALEAPELELAFPAGQEKVVSISDLTKAVKKSTGRDVKITLSKEPANASAGVVVRTPDSRRWVDNTMEARVQRLENQLRGAVSSILFHQK